MHALVPVIQALRLSETILTKYFFTGSSDDGGGGGGDTDAGRSDDERSLSSDSSVGDDGGRVVVVGDGCRSRSSSANSNNNNGKKETAMAVDDGGGVIGVGGMNSGFSFFELPANAAAMPYNLEVRNAGAGGVWTKSQLPKGVKYGPFLGKWGPKPVDSRFAWEVSGVLNAILYYYM